MLARARAAEVPAPLRAAVRAAWVARWSGILAVAGQRAFAASLLELPPAGSAALGKNEMHKHDAACHLACSQNLSDDRRQFDFVVYDSTVWGEALSAKPRLLPPLLVAARQAWCCDRESRRGIRSVHAPLCPCDTSWPWCHKLSPAVCLCRGRAVFLTAAT